MINTYKKQEMLILPVHLISHMVFISVLFICMCAFPFFACSTCLLCLSSFVFPMLSLLSDYHFMVGGSVSYLL